jgi:predicted secreted protein
MVATADSSDQTVDKDADLAAVAQDTLAALSADHGGDSACWAHLVCPECGAILSDGHHQGCDSEQVARSNGGVEIDQRLIRADNLDLLSNERASALAERRLMRSILIWTAIGVPVGATFFGLLVFVAARLSDVPAGAPVAMGAVVGVLAGVFFGMWTGVVVSVEETEHANLVLRQRPNA